MSLSAVLSNAMSGLAVAQNALSVTSSNVANVNTEGYTRKLAQQEAVVIDGRGAGARATDTTRAVDEFLGARLREQQGAARPQRGPQGDSRSDPGAAVRRARRARPGPANRISRVAAAAEALAGGPDQPALATAFIGAVAGSRARARAAPPARCRACAATSTSASPPRSTTVNADLQALADLNGQIARTRRRRRAARPARRAAGRASPARSRSPSTARTTGRSRSTRAPASRCSTARRASWSTSRRPGRAADTSFGAIRVVSAKTSSTRPRASPWPAPAGPFWSAAACGPS